MERAIFEIILEQREEEQKVGRNVMTSGQQEEEVNKWQTPRRLNVASSQRRDVSAISPSPSLKEKGTKIRGDRKTYGLGHVK